jgi:hypothetical protein
MSTNHWNHTLPDQLTLSLELLRLLQWLVEHEQDSLKRLITRSLNQGLAATIKRNNAIEDHELHNGIINFFTLIEIIMLEALNEHTTRTTLQRHLIPAINCIDTSACDTHTVQASIEQVTSKMHTNPQENPRELLIKELIKRWKPTKQSIH